MRLKAKKYAKSREHSAWSKSKIKSMSKYRKIPSCSPILASSLNLHFTPKAHQPLAENCIMPYAFSLFLLFVNCASLLLLMLLLLLSPISPLPPDSVIILRSVAQRKLHGKVATASAARFGRENQPVGRDQPEPAA